MTGRGLKGAHDAERAARMCELYRGGMTLQEIGTAYGLTRERVRQIIKREGVTREEGGVARRKTQRMERVRAAKEAARKARRDASAWSTHGCNYATLLANNGGLGKHYGAARAYYTQKRTAMFRGIRWDMTFPEWMRLWLESGHWTDRGPGGYVMARRHDLGPYAAWNIYIATSSQNIADYYAELERRGVDCPDGHKRLPERAARLYPETTP